MAYFVIQECVNCGTCELKCPNWAISEGDEIYVIDPDKCTECLGFYDSPQCVETCPVNAVQLNKDLGEDYDQLMAKWHRLHPGESPKGFVLRQDKTKPVIALVHSGTADPKGEKLLEKMDTLIMSRFPDHDVVWGFQGTYDFPRLRARGQNSYFERQLPLMIAATTLARLADAGRQKVALLLLSESESSHTRGAVEADTFGMDVKYGMPILSLPENRIALVKALEPEYGGGVETATVLIGHGTDAAIVDNKRYLEMDNKPYSEMDNYVRRNYRNVFVAMIHGAPAIDGVIEDIKKSGCSKVHFVNLMLTTGHITNDVMSDKPESWKNRIGLPADVYTGIVELPILTEHYINSIQSMLDQF